MEEYEELLDQYEQKINELQSQNELSEEENQSLNSLLLIERELLKLR